METEKIISTTEIKTISYHFRIKASNLLRTSYEFGMRNLSVLIKFIDQTPIINKFIQQQVDFYNYQETVKNLEIKLFFNSIASEGIESKEISFLYQFLKCGLERYGVSETSYAGLALEIIDPIYTGSKYQSIVDKFNRDIINPHFVTHINSYLTSMISDREQKAERDSSRTIHTRNYYEQSGSLGIGNMSGGEIKEGAKVAGVINEAAKQDLAQAAAEIQQILEQLSQTYPTKTLVQKAVVAEEAIKQIENNPNLKERVVSAIKAMGVQALMEVIDHPVANVLREGIEAFREPTDN
jgi:hypothetical protein